MLDDSKKNEFVSLFPTKRKSTICNKILDQVRAGINYPPTIANNVFDKFNKYPADNGDITSILTDNPFLFMDAIAHYIEYEKIPYEEKQTLKRLNAKEYINTVMATQPITEKQSKMLKGLGYAGSFDLNKLEASQMIDSLI